MIKPNLRLVRVFLLAFLLLLMPIAGFPLSSQSVLTVRAAGAKLNETDRILLKGERFKLTLKGKKSNMIFQSQNPAVASVSKTGIVKAVSAGRTTIVVTTPQKTYRCRIKVHDTMDIIVFSGQSNMTNVGRASSAPDVREGTAYEAIPKKNKISHLTEPFGVGQPKTTAKKSEQGATLVSAFVNAYYKKTKTPVLAMNTAIGGTSIGEWSGSYYQSVVNDVKAMEKLLKKKNLKKGHVYMVFYQGENDAMNSVVTTVYRKHMEMFFQKIQNRCDISCCFIIRISNDLNNMESYDKIAAIQTRLCMEDPHFVMVATIGSSFDGNYYQRDGVHLTQAALNKVGTQAGKMAGTYVVTGQEPSMKDPRYNNIYRSLCNY